MKLEDWLSKGKDRAWTEFRTRTGLLEVYVRRSMFDPAVIEIANVRSLDGFGSIRPLYQTLFADIPAISEQIINPDLDALLERWGWTHAYRDLADIPTRINKAFELRFPRFADAGSAREAIWKHNKEGAAA